MILVDPPRKNLSGPSRVAKHSKKNSSPAKFQTVDSNDYDSEIASASASAINPFLFLQEIDEYKEDQKKLRDSGNQILGSLNDLRLGLVSGELSEQHIINLKNTLENNRNKFKFVELQQVIDDIILRAEVELMKIKIAKGSISSSL